MTIYSLVGLIAGIAVAVFIVRYFVVKPSNLLIGYLQDFVGVFFIFSGTVKAIDPLGTAYKMEDYLVEFESSLNMSLEFFKSLSVETAVFMIVLEIVLGLALIIGYRKGLILFLISGLIVFFTLLTGFTYLSGWHFEGSPSEWYFVKTDMKVTDCGCFGDFLKLDPKISFIKDIFLSILIIILIAGSKHIKPLIRQSFGFGVLSLVTIGFTIFCISNFVWGLPIADFRPYKPGKNIPKQMEFVPPTVDYMYFYKNTETGESKGFIYPDKPTGDNWERDKSKERRDIVKDEGVPAIISNFQIVNEDGDIMDDQIIYNKDYVFMVVAYDLSHTDVPAWEQVNALAEQAEADGYHFFAVTASNYENFRHEVQAAYPFYIADATFLKTIVRANPGLVIIKDGTVVGKWHHNHIPTYSDLKATKLK